LKALAEAAAKGVMPPAPDFSAPTHKRFRAKLAEVAALAEARELAGLKGWAYSGFAASSVKAVLRNRDLAVVALQASRWRQPI
jgi:hypothetical protein